MGSKFRSSVVFVLKVTLIVRNRMKNIGLFATLIFLLAPYQLSAGLRFGTSRAVKATISELEKQKNGELVQSPQLSMISTFGGYGTANGKFDMNWGGSFPAVHFDGQYIHVTDPGNHRSQKFNSNGDFISWFGRKGGIFGSYNTGTPEACFQYWGGVLVDTNSNVWVNGFLPFSCGYLDPRGIFKFDSNGVLIGSITANVTAFSNFARNSTGQIVAFVNDTNTLSIFDPNGSVLSTFGGAGTSDGKFDNNSTGGSVVIDSFDNIFVADWNNQRIQKFDTNGNFLSKWPISGSSWQSLSIDETNHLYVFSYTDVTEYSPSGVRLNIYSYPASGSCSPGSQIHIQSNRIYCTGLSNQVFILQKP